MFLTRIFLDIVKEYKVYNLDNIHNFLIMKMIILFKEERLNIFSLKNISLYFIEYINITLKFETQFLFFSYFLRTLYFLRILN
jgi:hypothetical protein